MGKVAGAQVDRAVRGDSEPQQFFNVFGYLTDLLRGCPLLSCPGLYRPWVLFALWGRFWRVWGWGGVCTLTRSEGRFWGGFCAVAGEYIFCIVGNFTLSRLVHLCYCGLYAVFTAFSLEIVLLFPVWRISRNDFSQFFICNI